MSSSQAVSELLQAGAVIARRDSDGSVYFRALGNDAQRIADLVSSKYSRAATQAGSFASDRPSNSFSASAGPRPGTAKLAFSSRMNREVAMLMMDGRLSLSPGAFFERFYAGKLP